MTGRPYRYTREVLEPAVAASTSVAGVLRYLGLRANGGTHAHVSRAIKRFELDTSHFVRWRRNFIPHNRLAAEKILVRREPGRQREKPRMLMRALLELGVQYQCAICGVDGTWQGQTLSLDIDHIDGDFLNNQIENLRFLCPNCHRQTPNFAGRSRGRYTRGQQSIVAQAN
jgi:transposase-like protein